EGPPPARAWGEKNPEAAERLQAVRTAVAAIADEHRLPAENLLSPDSVRRLTWSPPEDLGEESIAAALRGLGAREWQIRLTAVAISKALKRLRTRREVEHD
ncbi:3'-5' exonuclease, partial [Carbonactinospora thermoautotrophica]